MVNYALNNPLGGGNVLQSAGQDGLQSAINSRPPQPPQGQVAEQAETHHKLSAVLQDKINALEQRLSPYLRDSVPEPPSPTTAGMIAPSLVRFAEHIRLANDNVGGSIARIDSILERLEI